MAPPKSTLTLNYRPEKLEYQLRRRGLCWSDLMKPPLALGSSTVNSLRHGKYPPKSSTLRRVAEYLKDRDVDPIIDSLLSPAEQPESAA
jgi:hypothetical protein